MTASRLLAPYFGTSLFVWTNIIAVIMSALAVGYWLGGKISERRPEMTFLLKIILIGGVLCFIIPFLIEPLSVYILSDLALMSSASWVILFGSFFATVFVFFLPIMLLGMTSPYLIKIISLRHTDVGNVSGTIFAVSTIGSIIGTFLPSIVFIAWLGSKKTILIFAVTLIIVAALGLVNRRRFIYLGMLAFVAGPIFIPPSLRPEPNIILETESVYQYIQVVEEGGVRSLKYNEGTGTQSVFVPDQFLTGHMYFDVMAASPALFMQGELDVLNIGLAGGTAVRGMSYLFEGEKQINIEGVEIDNTIIQIAKKYFDLNLDNLKIYNQDGRIFARSTEKKYDLILVDAYSNQIYIPWHLTTDEFFRNIEAILKEKGVVALNLNSTSEESGLFKALTNTMAHNFNYVYSAPIPRTFNYIIFAAREPIDFNILLDNQKVNENSSLVDLIQYLVENQSIIRYNPEIALLTDDCAPVEHLTDFMYWDYFVNLYQN